MLVVERKEKSLRRRTDKLCLVETDRALVGDKASVDLRAEHILDAGISDHHVIFLQYNYLLKESFCRLASHVYPLN